MAKIKENNKDGMSLKKVLCASLLFAISARASNLYTCGSEDLNFKKIYNLPGQGYWMQAMGSCEITYTNVGGFHGRRFSLCERKEKDMTRGIDPFPIPTTHGELYVHPGLTFFETKGLTHGFQDHALSGNYQSVGLLSGNAERGSRIRVLTADGSFRDYSVKKKADSHFDIQPEGHVQSICSSFVGSKDPRAGGKFYETPILSRNGRMIAMRDSSSQETMIYQVLDGECSLLQKIKFPTDKVTFGFDNRTVLFTTAMNTGSGPRPKAHQTLMSLDLRTGNIVPLTGPQENVQYMTFTEDGRIYYTREPGEHDVREAGILVEMDSEFVKPVRNSNLELALGTLYTRKCPSDTASTDETRVIGRRLNQSACKDIVETATPEEIQSLQVTGITKTSLLEKCSHASQPHFEFNSGAQ